MVIVRIIRYWFQIKNGGRNIIKIAPFDSTTTNATYGPGLILNVNKQTYKGFYFGQYFTNGSLRITKEDYITTNNFVISFEQDDTIKANITNVALTDNIVIVDSDKTLRTKPLLTLLPDSQYLASSSKNGTISNTQFNLLTNLSTLNVNEINGYGANISNLENQLNDISGGNGAIISYEFTHTSESVLQTTTTNGLTSFEDFEFPSNLSPSTMDIRSIQKMNTLTNMCI